jgi:hypothetical protein
MAEVRTWPSTPLSAEQEAVAGTDRGRHLPGRRACAGCGRRAAIRRMHRGPDGGLYGSGCARKRGLITPRPRIPRAVNVPATRRETLFDQPAREQPAMSQTPLTTARRFVIERNDTRILDGVLWPDGTCSLRWRQAPRSFVSWDAFADAEKLHCGDGLGRVIWVDEEPPAAPVAGGELAEADL